MDRRITGLFNAIARFRPLVIYVALGVVGISNLIIRFDLLGRYAAPPSADFGLYLSHAHIFLGEDVGGFGPTKPPILFVFLIGLLQFTDPLTAVRIVSVFPILMLPLPFYKLASRYSQPVWALVATILLVFNEGYSEMVGWGGVPDILAISFLLASLRFFMKYLDHPTTMDWILASVFLSLTAGSHLLTTLMSVMAFGVWFLLELLVRRQRGILLPFVKWIGLAAILSLPYVPIYLSTSFQLAPELKPIWPDGVTDAVTSLQFLTRDSAVFWTIIGLLGAVGWAAYLRKRSEGMLYLAFVLVATISAITFLRDNSARPLYYIYIPLLGTYPAFLTWANKRQRHDLPPRERYVVTGLFVAFVVVSSSTMVIQSVNRMSLAVDWYHAIDADELRALDWLKANTLRQAVVATAGLPFFEQSEGTRYGWWIEGYAERKSFYAGSEVFAVIAAERQMVRDANIFFSGNEVLTSTDIRVADNVPGAKGAPEISLWDGSVYRPVLYVNDAFVLVGSMNGTGVPSTTALYPPATGNSRIVQGLAPYIRSTRILPSVEVNRTESITTQGVQIRLSFRANGPVSDAVVPLWTSAGLRISSFTTSTNEAQFAIADELGFNRSVTLRVSLPSGGSYSVNATNADPQFNVPVVSLNLSAPPSSPIFEAVIDLGFPGVPPTDPSSVRGDDAFSIAAAYHVTFVFQSGRLFMMSERFREDTVHFTPVYRNASITIYAIQP